MARGALCDSARSSPFILRAGGTYWDNTEVATPKMGGFLEIILGTSVAASREQTDLATSLLGYTAAPRRKLRREMALRC